MEPSSLQNLALAKIAVALLSREEFSKHGNQEELIKLTAEIEAKVMEKLLTLPLPNALQQEVAGLLKPMAWHMLEWYTYLSQFYLIKDGDGINLSPHLHWSSSTITSIDKVTSVELLVANQSVEPKARYKVACDYGLLHHIQALSLKIPSEIAALSANHYPYYYYAFVEEERCKLIKFWGHYATGEHEQLLNLISGGEEQLLSPHQYLFKRALLSYNPTTVKHFYGVLTPAEKELRALIAHLNDTYLPKGFSPEIMCFLLSKMNEHQRVEIFQRNAVQLLSTLLNRPYQSSFLPTINNFQLWEFMEEKGFNRLLSFVFGKINCAREKCAYRDIFRKFWRSSPEWFKKYVVVREGFKLDYFYEVGGEEVFRAMLEHADAVNKKKILDRYKELFYSANNIRDKKMHHFLAFGVEEAMKTFQRSN